MPAGILLVDKPQGLTSHDVVARIRRFAGTRKVGHAGTLDPMATGLLVIGVDSATRLLHFIVGLEKEYLATIRLGQSSTTDDAEGELSAPASPDALRAITPKRLSAAVQPLTGRISQVPSSVSAIRVNGQRAYAMVRAGETVELTAREVTVSEFEILAVRHRSDGIDVDVRVVCSSGTYIRALARDLGASLNLGGHLTMLRRTRIGPFDVAHGSTLDQLSDGVLAALIAPTAAATRTLAELRLTDEETIDLGHGKRISANTGDPGSLAAAVSTSGRLVAIVERRSSTWKVVTGFPDERLPE